MTGETQQNAEGPATLGMYTETLARLYLRQGFIREALCIYRRLVQERPQEQRLHEQLRALEQQVASGLPERVSVTGSSAARVGDTPAVEARRAQRVIAELERWLRYLQQHHHAPKYEAC